jgi:hypothetical protein
MKLRRASTVLLAAVALLAMAATSSAQYFGRNKVQYRRFDFQVTKTEHFDVYNYPEEAEAAALVGRMAERWYQRLTSVLDHDLEGRQPLILYASHPEFQQTNAIGGSVGEGTGGVTEAFKRRIVLPMAGPLQDTDHVVGHELVHAFQYDITGEGRPGGQQGVLRLPLWFIEGMAEYLSIGPVDPNTSLWLRDALNHDKLPAVKKLDDPKYFPYRFGHAFWAYVAGRWGDRAVGRILKSAGKTGDAIGAIEDVLGVSEADLTRQWHAALRAGWTPVLEARGEPEAFGPAVITKKNSGGELNLGPALSPDGRRLAYLSERSLFAIDVFIADAQGSGARQKVKKISLDPHFESLQFINSAGSWDPTGTRLAFGTVDSGEPVLTIVEARSGAIQREIRLEELGEVFNPTWSPDGRRIAFSAIAGGLMDLHVVDVASGERRQLTKDAYAEVTPAWSPDGRTIAFATDRFTLDLATLSGAHYRLALLDVETGDIRALPGFDNARSNEPEWGPGGQLFFVSDRDGVPNVYRMDLASKAVVQLTNLRGGVSGITTLSPALSVAARTGRAVYSAYVDGRHEIFAIEAGAPGTPVELKPADDRPAAALLAPGTPREALSASIPPVVRPQRRDPPNAGEPAPAESTISEIVAGRGTTRTGPPGPKGTAPDSSRFTTEDYKPKLSLDFVGQPYVTAGVDRQGAFVGGGTSFFFSDMLGNHNLAAMVQAQGRVEDIGGMVYYTNQERRLNWGAAVEHVPLTTAGIRLFEDQLPTGHPVIVEQLEVYRETHSRATVFGYYPFSRNLRFTLGTSLRRIGFGDEVRRNVYSAQTGQLLYDEEIERDAPDALVLGESNAALVYDTSVFGATGPIVGRRFRLEVAPTYGTLNFTETLADVRQYVMPVRPFTIAARGLYFGRHGSGAADPRLSPLFLGHPGLVRGYDVDSFDLGTCANVRRVQDCPTLNTLSGTQVMIGNLELRFPPWGALGGSGFYGPLPIDLLAFVDTGVAWSSGQTPTWFGGDRRPVTSVGFGARANVFGFAVVEVDYVKALDRPNGWTWEFNLTPGF